MLIVYIIIRVNHLSAAMAQDIAWATDANVLAAMLDATLSVWLCPNCVHYSDRKIIRKTRIDKESRFGIFSLLNQT